MIFAGNTVAPNGGENRAYKRGTKSPLFLWILCHTNVPLYKSYKNLHRKIYECGRTFSFVKLISCCGCVSSLHPLLAPFLSNVALMRWCVVAISRDVAQINVFSIYFYFGFFFLLSISTSIHNLRKLKISK